jgi:glycosyltransferase involved in cell wall biosynthesis
LSDILKLVKAKPMEENKKTISFVVPCYNEAENVRVFYQEMKNLLDFLKYDYEIIFVNDGSKDNTLDILLQLNSVDSKVRVVNLSRNFGKEIALSAGLDFSSGDVVIPMDVDLQDPPSVVPKLLEKWEEGYDVVYATREKREGDSFMKKMTAKWFYKIFSFISEIDIPKNTGDFRLMDQRVVVVLSKLKERHRFMKGLFAWVGFKQTGISYVRNPRKNGKTKFNYFRLLDLAIEGITSFTMRPLRIPTVVGVFMAVLASVAFVIILLIGTNNLFNVFITSIIIFLFGIQFLFLGVMGEYIGKVFNETKNRPLYIINGTIGFE